LSACSIDTIQARLATAACLTPIGAADMSVAWLAAPQVFAGATFTHTATLSNAGVDGATGVTFTATAQPGLSILAAEAGGASCTVAANTASCALGAVGGGAARAVTLTLSAAAPGTFNLTATVEATSDADSSDNSAAVAVSAIAGVDLRWSGAAPAIQLDTPASITATLANAADFAATSVAVTADLGAGLQAAQATLGGTDCSAAGQSVTCPVRTVPARGSVALVLDVTGTTAGSHEIVLSAVANETDVAPADNRLALAVMIGAPAQGGGGGGAAGWPAVLALLAAATARRRRPS
jgi:hypothetical protein